MSLFGSLLGALTKGDNLMGLLGLAGEIYGGYQSYKSQQEAYDIMKEAQQEQVRTAGLQEQQAAKQEMAAIEQQRINEQNMIQAAIQNAQEEENLRKRQKQEIGERRARAAASGVVMDTGSFGRNLTEAQKIAQSEFDWLRKANQSEIQAMESKTKYDRQMADMAAGNTRIAASNTRAGAVGTGARASQARASAYGSLLGSGRNIFNLGEKTNWFGLE